MNINKNGFRLQVIFLTIFHVYLFYCSLALHTGLNLIYNLEFKLTLTQTFCCLTAMPFYLFSLILKKNN